MELRADQTANAYNFFEHQETQPHAAAYFQKQLYNNI